MGRAPGKEWGKETGPNQRAPAGPAAHEGTVYTIGGSSAQTSGGMLNHPAMVHSYNLLGSLILDVSGPRLDLRYLDDLGVVRDSFTIVKGSSASVAADASRGGLQLGPAMPNPFAREMTLDFTLPAESRVRLEIFDAGGRRVATLANGTHAAGPHLARW